MKISAGCKFNDKAGSSHSFLAHYKYNIMKADTTLLRASFRPFLGPPKLSELFIRALFQVVTHV